MSKKFQLQSGEFDLKDWLIAKAMTGIIEVPKTPENFELRFISSIKLFTSLVEARSGKEIKADGDANSELERSLKQLKKASEEWFDMIGGAKDLDYREFLVSAKEEAGLSDEEVKHLGEEIGVDL